MSNSDEGIQDRSDVERRAGQRKSIGFEVLINDGSEDTLIMQASNISETGLYLLSEGENRPALGSIVLVTLNAPIKNESSPLTMLVTRMDNSGIGLQQIEA